VSSEVRHQAEEQRYVITVDGEPAGLTQYEQRHGAVAFLHTEIDDRFAGQGLASALIRAALDDVREQGGQVLPYCPFVRSWIAKHPEYVDLVPADRRAQFELSPGVQES
jgi:predicted GNAT family acetyltransferase